MLHKSIKYTYSDITIVPSADFSPVDSRSKCTTRDSNGMLPIFTAPMSSVVSADNYNVFLGNGIRPIIPRNVDLWTRMKLAQTNLWIAMSLSEFRDTFTKHDDSLIGSRFNVCIDIANGHMKSLYDVCSLARLLPYDLSIMVGNIANPEIYRKLCKLNSKSSVKIVDYVRCGIGSGNGCITTSNTGIHYPMASLIDECRTVADDVCVPENKRPMIVADGGIRNYSDVIKAIALGADFVMIGGLFSACIESAAEKMVSNLDGYLEECGQKQAEEAFKKGEKVFSRFYGMASGMGQEVLFGKKRRTSEGIVKDVPVEHSIVKWVENMDDYLKSAMSYTGNSDLDTFRRQSHTIVISENSKLAVNK